MAPFGTTQKHAATFDESEIPPNKRSTSGLYEKDDPGFIDVPQKPLLKGCNMIRDVLNLKVLGENFDKKDIIFWDAAVSESTKEFSAGRAVYIKNMISCTKKDTTPLESVHARHRWGAIKIRCEWLQGNRIKLGDYTWKKEKDSALIMAEWLKLCPSFVDELEEYEGVDHELQPED
ncbi:hypothetical protein IFR05_008415 [Cadophora sp. M221]|nr:hypothetical protein IFR05_008415 [Cadophora sp. M221]